MAKILLDVWSKMKSKYQKYYMQFSKQKSDEYSHKSSIREKVLFWNNDHLAVFEAFISCACFGEFDYKHKSDNNFHNFFKTKSRTFNRINDFDDFRV